MYTISAETNKMNETNYRYEVKIFIPMFKSENKRVVENTLKRRIQFLLSDNILNGFSANLLVLKLFSTIQTKPGIVQNLLILVYF